MSDELRSHSFELQSLSTFAITTEYLTEHSTLKFIVLTVLRPLTDLNFANINTVLIYPLIFDNMKGSSYLRKFVNKSIQYHEMSKQFSNIGYIL